MCTGSGQGVANRAGNTEKPVSVSFSGAFVLL